MTISKIFNQIKLKIVSSLLFKLGRFRKLAFKNQHLPQNGIRNEQKIKFNMDRLRNQFLQHVIPSSQPTQSQINQVIKQVSTKFPHTNTFSIIESLYFNLLQIKQQDITNNIKIISPQQIPSKYFDFHNFLKKMIAKSYYFYGFGYEKFLNYMLKKHASFHINEEMYMIFSKGMVLQIYRNLQKILIRDGHMIKLKHKNLVMKLNQWILSKIQSPPQKYNELLRRFIAKKYEINDSHFSSTDAKKLYDILQEKYDPFATKDIEKVDQCLDCIEINSNDSQELNFDNLLYDNYTLGQQMNLDLNYKSKDANPISNIQHQDRQNYLKYDIYQLNFDQ